MAHVDRGCGGRDGKRAGQRRRISEMVKKEMKEKKRKLLKRLHVSKRQ